MNKDVMIKVLEERFNLTYHSTIEGNILKFFFNNNKDVVKFDMIPVRHFLQTYFFIDVKKMYTTWNGDDDIKSTVEFFLSQWSEGLVAQSGSRHSIT